MAALPTHTLHQLLSEVMTRDFPVLKARLRQLQQRLKAGKPADRMFAELERDIQRSRQRYQSRLTALPQPQFDPALPVNQRLEDLKQAISQHQVVIVCGETGSGKTTQLPKLCLELGRGVRGLIGHTQPRRLAARSVAQRIAQELQTKLGEQVGFKVRFTDHSSDRSYIKLMTDGILLAETQNDRYLNQYDTLIIDEAHERSLNIDFLLGYLKQILPRRPDLKVIVTSATIDAERFSQHFNGAPVLEVSGRTYPVEIRYRPLQERDEDEAELEMEEAIVEAVQELQTHGAGDVLVFLPGEREIRDTADALRQMNRGAGYDILPLFARLSNEEQNRIFQTGGERRRVVLATNVAETSLTVPGIKYVIDTGLARVKRYSPRAKVEQLHVEKISQAAARQRAGRCGRVQAGVCIRLYSEEDFNARPAFTDPEIIRSNLAAVILRMASLRLGAIDEFPFIEAPSRRLIADGVQLLHELGALDDAQQLTPLGNELARIPVDPRIGRMLLAGRQFHCVHEILILAAALSIQDPRERPFEAREAAERAQARFKDEKSDFLAFLNLWQFFHEALTNKTSNRQLINLCHQHFLSYLRLREWRELHGQLKNIADELGLRDNTTPATFEQIHCALLTGLLGNIGMKTLEGDGYLGARGIQFHIFPGSGLRRTKAKWILAAELTETTRLYGRCIAAIEPEWVEGLAEHLVKRHYFEPHWEKARGEVVATEKVTLYGLPIVARRRVSYGRINPEEAREIFIREALAVGEFQTRAAFFRHNQTLIREVQQLEHKARRQDVLVDEQTLFDFYNERIPANVFDTASFEHWLDDIQKTEPRRLYLSREYLMQHAAEHVTEEQFPTHFDTADGRLKLRYRFEPNHVLDGVTVDIPLPILNRLPLEPFEWLVPGMLREKVTLLIKSLPKGLRRLCVPVPDCVTRFLSSPLDKQHSLLSQLVRFLQQDTGHNFSEADFVLGQLPLHCWMNFRILDDGRQELGMGRDLSQLQQQFGEVAQLTFRESSLEWERDEVIAWDFGALPAVIQFARGRQQLTGYPALAVEGERVAIRLFDTELAADASHRQGVIRLLQLQLKEQMKQLQKGWPELTQTALLLRGVINREALLADAITAICDRALVGEDVLPRDERAFEEQKTRARARLPAVKQAVATLCVDIAGEYQKVAQSLEKHPLASALREQLQTLIYQGFLSATPWPQLAELPRYLRAMGLRMDKYRNNPARDQKHAADIQRLWREWESAVAQQQGMASLGLLAVRWQLEELRVSLFAQELKTPYPVSVKRVEAELRAQLAR